MEKKSKEKEWNLLQERLDQICLEEGQGEEEIDQILKRMDELNPIPEDDFFSAGASYIRFRKRYLGDPTPGGGKKSISELIDDISADIDKVDKKNKHLYFFPVGSKLRRNLVAAAAVVFMCTILGMGTVATGPKAFFEYVNRKTGWLEFLVTESDRGMEEKAYGVWQYDDLDKLGEECEDFLIPQYIPDGMIMEDAILTRGKGKDILSVNYRNPEKNTSLRIAGIKYDIANPAIEIGMNMQFVEKATIESKEVEFFISEDELTVQFFDERILYTISGEISKEELINMVKSMEGESY